MPTYQMQAFTAFNALIALEISYYLNCVGGILRV